MQKPYLVKEATPNAAGYAGICVHCGKAATKEALFNGDGITVIEKYCEDCMKTEKFTALMTFCGR